MLITPPCGDGDVFIAKSFADPLQGLDEALGAAWPPTNFTIGDVGGTFSKTKDKNHCSIAHFGPILKTKVLLESPIQMLSKNFNFENQIKKCFRAF